MLFWLQKQMLISSTVTAHLVAGLFSHTLMKNSYLFMTRLNLILQVHTELEGLLSKHQLAPQYTLGSKIASGLSVIYLPPLPPPVDTYIPPRRSTKTPTLPMPSSTLQESTVETKSQQQQKQSKPLRTSLK